MSAPRLLLSRGPAGLPPPEPIDWPRLQLPASPNAWLAAPPGSIAARHEAVPLLPVAPDAAWEELRRLGDRFRRVWKLAEWPELRQVQWVARTRWMNFPDLVSGAVIEMPGGAGLFLYSRSLLGHTDFGVNRRRVAVWRAALQTALARGG